MTKWNLDPLTDAQRQREEAIVRAALERAAENLKLRADGERQTEIYFKEKGKHYKAREAAHFARCLDQLVYTHILGILKDPEAVAEIIKKAGEAND